MYTYICPKCRMPYSGQGDFGADYRCPGCGTIISAQSADFVRRKTRKSENALWSFFGAALVGVLVTSMSNNSGGGGLSVAGWIAAVPAFIGFFALMNKARR